MHEEIQEALATLPSFAGLDHSDYSAHRLGGLTNLVFRIEPETPRAEKALAGKLVARLPGAGTADYIDRGVEAHNAAVAAAAGVSPEVVFADPVSGFMVTRFVENTVTMTPENFKSRTGSPARAGRVFRTLHDSGREFRFRFELFSMISDYLKVLSTKSITLPDGYHEVVRASDPVRLALEKNPGRVVACHCDPLCENFLDDGERMWLVDWEYSGMNDPLWDLGDLSVEAGFDAAQDREMLEAWAGGTPSEEDVARMVIYKAMCDLLWTLWGLIQHANDNPADDFWAYAVNRFERCKALMATPEFNRHVAVIAQG
jgi:thiamine kinase-like enzyme